MLSLVSKVQLTKIVQGSISKIHPLYSAGYSTRSTHAESEEADEITSPRIIPDNCFHSEAKRKKFLSYLPGILKEVEEYAATADPIENGKHVVKMIEYQSEGGKKYGGICTAETYQVLAPKSMQSKEDVRKAYILGWCAEFVVDSINMVDDIMDKGKMRRRKPCWYTFQKNPALAATDACLINQSTYYLLGKYFGNLPCYLMIQELFNTAQFNTAVGQWMEMRAASKGMIHSFETYKMFTEHISVFIAGIFPVLLGLTYAGYTDSTVVQRCCSVLRDLGFFYNVQDDFLDCFSTLKSEKMTGTDIKEGKCTWLSVMCCERASPAQKDYFKLNYGKNCQENVDKVKQLYVDLKLPELYDKFSNDFYSSLLSRAEQETDSNLKTLYHKLLEPIIDSNYTGGLFL
ncbi:hypothetical protein DMENIID0001_012660 [Sergentomyia squamirostris]